MKKVIFILSIVSLILIIVVIATIVVKNDKKAPSTIEPVSTTTPVTSFPDNEDNIPSEPEIIFQNNEGETVNIKDFLQNSSVTPDIYNQGYYYLGNTFMPDVNGVDPHYVITYDSAEEFFNVTLLREPLRQARFEAEEYLRTLLKINNASMCNLKYTLSVPSYVNKDFSGRDYRFSFCEDAIGI